MAEEAADLSGIAVIFDLDGTLIDSAGQIHATVNRVLGGMGLPETARATVQGFVGNGLPALIDRLLAHHAHPLPPEARAGLIARFEAEYSREHGLTTLYPGVRAALEALRGAGAALGVCTNKPIAPARAVLDHLGLTPLFGAVLGGDSLPVRKPDPDHLRATARALARPGVVFAGDSEVDAETAKAAGVPFLLFSEGYRKSPVEAIFHTAVFADWAEVPGLVREVSGGLSAVGQICKPLKSL